MITSNVIQRVFHIKVPSGTGTAFTIEHEGKQYLVTAAHLAEQLVPPYSVHIFHDKVWKKIDLNLTGICHSADTAVFAASFALSPALYLPATTDGAIYGQDVYFLGFPFQISPEAGKINYDFPMPLVKKACLSGFLDGDSNSRLMLLDGHNNPGFSGGPVVFSEQGKPVSSSFRVMGIISGYRFSEEPIYSANIQIPANVRANTGIVLAYDISHAIDEIKKNPNGYSISTPSTT